MRTNIVIDDAIMQAAMRGSDFKTKKEAVEAGLKLLARQAHYREVLKWEGKLHWDDQPDASGSVANMVSERIVPYVLPSKPAKKPTLVSKTAPHKRKAAQAA